MLNLITTKVRETLGTGTFGRVRLVSLKHQGTEHHLALKMMKKSVVLQLKQVLHIHLCLANGILIDIESLSFIIKIIVMIY